MTGSRFDVGALVRSTLPYHVSLASSTARLRRPTPTMDAAGPFLGPEDRAVVLEAKEVPDAFSAVSNQMCKLLLNDGHVGWAYTAWLEEI